MGRPNKGLGHVDGLCGEEEPKRRLRAILGTLSGELSVDEACEHLGIKRAFFGELRARALAGALVGLEPRPVGRPRQTRTATPDDVDAIVREAAELRREVQILRAQLDVTTALARSGPAPAPRAEGPRSKSRGLPRRPARTTAAAW